MNKENDIYLELSAEVLTFDALGSDCYWYRAGWVRYEELTEELCQCGLNYWFDHAEVRLKVSFSVRVNGECKLDAVSLPVRMSDSGDHPEYVILPPLVAPLLGVIASDESELLRRDIEDVKRTS